MKTALAPAKFTFDLDLGQRPRPVRTVDEDAVSALVENARMEAYAAGVRAGEQSTTAQAATALATAAERLANHTVELTAAFDTANRERLAEAADLAFSIARKLAGALIAREPTVEIEALLAECMSTLEGVPHLVVRCHPDLADALRDLAQGQMALSGFTGRLVVMGDPDRKFGDARLEWVDGGLVRDIEAITAAVDAKISDYLAARGAVRQGTQQ